LRRAEDLNLAHRKPVSGTQQTGTPERIKPHRWNTNPIIDPPPGSIPEDSKAPELDQPRDNCVKLGFGVPKRTG
jgi:hypothetical protein